VGGTPALIVSPHRPVPDSGTITGRFFTVPPETDFWSLWASKGARKPNGGFKRLLQQELLDRFDRFLEG
jgi:hypothetical protein